MLRVLSVQYRVQIPSRYVIRLFLLYGSILVLLRRNPRGWSTKQEVLLLQIGAEIEIAYQTL